MPGRDTSGFNRPGEHRVLGGGQGGIYSALPPEANNLSRHNGVQTSVRRQLAHGVDDREAVSRIFQLDLKNKNKNNSGNNNNNSPIVLTSAK